MWARRPRSFTTDRTEFLGRNGTPEAPAALGRASLADRAGELCDPCAALMTGLELPPGGEDEVVFMLGQAESVEEAQRLVRFLCRDRPRAAGAGAGPERNGTASSGPSKSARPIRHWT